MMNNRRGIPPSSSGANIHSHDNGGVLPFGPPQPGYYSQFPRNPYFMLGHSLPPGYAPLQSQLPRDNHGIPPSSGANIHSHGNGGVLPPGPPQPGFYSQFPVPRNQYFAHGHGYVYPPPRNLCTPPPQKKPVLNLFEKVEQVESVRENGPIYDSCPELVEKVSRHISCFITSKVTTEQF